MPDNETTEVLTADDGTRIALHRLGGDGPPLLVSHATGLHAHCYLPMMPKLGQVFTVWAIDHRGHGASPLEEDESFDWHDLAGDLLVVVDHLGGGPIAAFGHSMGGATLLLGERRRPGTFSRLWVYEPIILPDQIERRNSMMVEAAKRRRAEFPSRAEALYRYASRPPLGALRADALAAYVEHGFVDTEDGTVRLACSPTHEAMTFTGAELRVADVADVTTPTLVARGMTTEAPSAADFADGTAEALPNAELKVYDDIGHFGPLEAPDRIADDALTFLTS